MPRTRNDIQTVANSGLRGRTAHCVVTSGSLPVAGLPFRVVRTPSRSDPWGRCHRSGLSLAPTWMAVRCRRPGEARPGLHRTWVRLGGLRHWFRYRGSSVYWLRPSASRPAFRLHWPSFLRRHRLSPKVLGRTGLDRWPRLSLWTFSGTCPSRRRCDAGDFRSDSFEHSAAAQLLLIVSGGHLGIWPHGPPASRSYSGTPLLCYSHVNYPSRPSWGRSGGQSDGWMSADGEMGSMNVLN